MTLQLLLLRIIHPESIAQVNLNDTIAGCNAFSTRLIRFTLWSLSVTRRAKVQRCVFFTLQDNSPFYNAQWVFDIAFRLINICWQRYPPIGIPSYQESVGASLAPKHSVLICCPPVDFVTLYSKQANCLQKQMFSGSLSEVFERSMSSCSTLGVSMLTHIQCGTHLQLQMYEDYWPAVAFSKWYLHETA